MAENNFYANLSSNTTSSTSFNNKIGNFVTRLPRKINLGEDWEVALTEISYTKSWYNIFEDQRIKLVYKSHETKNSKWIKAGNYNDIEHLFYKVNTLLKEYKKEDFETGEISGSLDTAFTPKIAYDKHTNKVQIILGKIIDQYGKLNYIYPQFSGLLLEILGLTYTNTNSLHYDYNHIIGTNMEVIDNIKTGNTILNFGELNMNAGIHSLYAYCDLIQPVLVGHREVQLLRNVEIPNNLKFGDQVVLKYQTPYYYPLLRNEFDSIEIDIKDDTNRQIDFAFGRTSLTLHFRKKDKDVNESIYKLLH